MMGVKSYRRCSNPECANLIFDPHRNQQLCKPCRRMKDAATKRRVAREWAARQKLEATL